MTELPRFREPTADECNVNARVASDDGTVGYAIWYPQMGGYSGRALAFDYDGCMGVYVWHDGAFPFGDESDTREEGWYAACPRCGYDGGVAFKGRSPAFLHHCDPEQFIAFGKTLAALFPDRGEK